MKKIIIPILVIVFLNNCKIDTNNNNSRNKVDNKSIETISVKLKTAKKYDFKIVDSSEISYTKLSTSPKCLIGRIDKFYIYNDQFVFISDNKLFMFNKNGKFLFKLNKTGKGPHEYITLTDVYINKSGIINILDKKGRKILKYNSSGKHLKTFNTGLIGESFIKLNKDNWCIHIGSNITEESKYKLNFYSERSKEIISKKRYITKDEYKWRYLKKLITLQDYQSYSFINMLLMTQYTR